MYRCMPPIAVFVVFGTPAAIFVSSPQRTAAGMAGTLPPTPLAVRQAAGKRGDVKFHNRAELARARGQHDDARPDGVTRADPLVDVTNTPVASPCSFCHHFALHRVAADLQPAGGRAGGAGPTASIIAEWRRAAAPHWPQDAGSRSVTDASGNRPPDECTIFSRSASCFTSSRTSALRGGRKTPSGSFAALLSCRRFRRARSSLSSVRLQIA